MAEVEGLGKGENMKTKLKKKEIIRKERGITLVSLVITIIILLILAGVALSFILGENGLIEKSKNGVSKYKEAAENETTQLESFEEEFRTLMGEPKIPEGFEHIDGTVETGYVIRDKNKGNEFVWVPVDTNKFELEKWNNRYELGESAYHEDTNNATYKAMRDSVMKNGGFYVGRYELGVEGGTLNVNPSNVYEGGRWTTEGQAVIKENAVPYNYINQTKAIEVSRDLYEGKSYLLYGVQWDAIMKWLKSSGYDVANDSSGWGNCSDSEFEFKGWYVDFSGEVLNGNQLNWKNATTQITKTPGQKILMRTGGERNKAKNIYDLAGNLVEWTQEKYGENKVVVRGGKFSDTGGWISGSWSWLW